MSANAVIMSLGNFTDAFMRNDLSKMSVGFIPDLGDVSFDLLLKHLVSKSKLAKTNAEKAIKSHKLFIEREYWAMLFDPLKRVEHTGVKMYILGRGLCTIFPRLAFFVGDDPAIHRYCGVYEGNANHSCIHCKYSVKNDGLFDPDKQEPRDPSITNPLCELAISGSRKKANGCPILLVEKEAMEVLKSQGLHYLPNATVGVPMGFTLPNIPNNVHNSPCDILHTFGCGICKTTCLWTLSIVMQISKQKEFKFNMSILDRRISSNKDWPKLPNVSSTYFAKGVSFINKNKSSSEKQRTTGSAGGFRSCEFVPLLLQLYLAIGFEGDILPLTSTFGKVTEIVLKSISSVLDAYFSVRTSPLTTERIVKIEQTQMISSNNFTALYQLMDRVHGSEIIRLPMIRKDHARNCSLINFMKKKGTADKGDSASYESSHRLLTVGSWKSTSRRYDTMNAEMAHKAMLLNLNSINDFLHAVITNTMASFVARVGPYVAPE